MKGEKRDVPDLKRLEGSFSLESNQIAVLLEADGMRVLVRI
jgi:hypothetical protein